MKITASWSILVRYNFVENNKIAFNDYFGISNKYHTVQNLNLENEIKMKPNENKSIQ